MATRYRDAQGRFISKAEFERRKKISNALKAYHKKKRQNEKPKRISKSSKTNSTKRKVPTKKKTKVKRKSKSATRKKRTTKKQNRSTTKIIKGTRRKFSISTIRKKIKTFPVQKRDKNGKPIKQNKDFFFADKQFFELAKNIRIETLEDLELFKKIVKEIRPDLANSLKKLLYRTRKDKRIDIGYMIDIEFKGKNGKVKKQRTTSFIATSEDPRKANKNNLDKETILITNQIEAKFREYTTENKAFNGMSFKGFVTEIGDL